MFKSVKTFLDIEFMIKKYKRVFERDSVLTFKKSSS